MSNQLIKLLFVMAAVLGLQSVALGWGWQQVHIKNTLTDRSAKVSMIYHPDDDHNYFRFTPNWVSSGQAGALDTTSPTGGSGLKNLCVKFKFNEGGTVLYFHNKCGEGWCATSGNTYTIGIKDNQIAIDLGSGSWWPLKEVSSCPDPHV